MIRFWHVDCVATDQMRDKTAKKQKQKQQQQPKKPRKPELLGLHQSWIETSFRSFFLVKKWLWTYSFIITNLTCSLEIQATLNYVWLKPASTEHIAALGYMFNFIRCYIWPSNL